MPIYLFVGVFVCAPAAIFALIWFEMRMHISIYVIARVDRSTQSDTHSLTHRYTQIVIHVCLSLSDYYSSHVSVVLQEIYSQ